MAQKFENAFKTKHVMLCEKIDVSHGLLYELLDRSVITKSHKDAIEGFRVEQDRVNKLLEVLSKRPDDLFQAFCDSLRSCHQGHIVGLLNAPAQGGQNSSSFSNSSGFSSGQCTLLIPVTSANRPAAVQSSNGVLQSAHSRSSTISTNGSNGVDSGIFSLPSATSNSQGSPSVHLSRTANNIPADVKIVDFYDLKQLERIAEGGFGIIHRAQHAEWKTVAYKELKATVINPRDKIARELRHEVEAHVLRHPNVVAVLGLVFQSGHYGLILEYAAHGGLDVFVSAYDVEWPMKMSLASDVVHGMNYLHAKVPPVIHGDLRIQNVLVADGFVAKICDFGLSKWKQYSTIRTPSRSLRSSVTHIPPENWLNINQTRTVKYDVYSFGILLWELMAEKTPFEPAAGNTDLIRTSVINSQRPDLEDIDDRRQIPAHRRDLIKDWIQKYWAQDPNDRPTFAEMETSFSRFMKENDDDLKRALSNLKKDIRDRSEQTQNAT